MNIEKMLSNIGISEGKKAEIIQRIENAPADEKSGAIYEAIEEITYAKNEALVNRIVEESEKARDDAAYRESHKLRYLTKNEISFYEKLRAGSKAMQTLTADQIDIIPTEIVDKTLADIKEASGVTDLISFAPSGVKKWLFGSKTGSYAWGTLTSALGDGISATLTSENIEVFKLYALCVVPKSIRDLEIGYVDKYFTAVLNEQMTEGIAYGFINGDGKESPIGITKKVTEKNSDGTAKAKTKITTLTSFSPSGLKTVLSTLSNGGKRKVSSIAIIANPSDVYNYVNPALYGDSFAGGYEKKSFVDVTVYEEPSIAQGTAVVTIPGVYTMGFSGMKVDEYKETKALDDADVIIAKTYANGRAYDDNTAVVFDPTKLVEYIASVKTVTGA